jgi:3-methyladenine DNA glycosylase/8-oxoguanine DNA glycosylase
MTDYTKARRHLMRRDPVLRDIIKRIGPCELHNAGPADPFVALTMSIASQQLSTKAADTIFGRFKDLFPPDRRPTAGRVLSLSEDQIRGVGFSRPKASFIKDLAARVHDGRLDLVAMHDHSDEDVMAQLVAVKGIGRWTAEIFLMFRLLRPDILPADDLGLMNAVQRAYRLRKRPTPDKLRKMGEAWRPYRSVASWYLWQSLSK